MANIEYMAVSYALVGILILGYVGVQHNRISYLESLIEGEDASEDDTSDDTINGSDQETS